MVSCAGSVVAVPSDWSQPGLCCWAPVLMQTMLPPLIQESMCAGLGQVINLLFVLAYTAEMFAKMAQERTLKCAQFAPVCCEQTILRLKHDVMHTWCPNYNDACSGRLVCCHREWARHPWNLAEALIVLGSLATVMTHKGETREVPPDFIVNALLNP